MIMSPRSGGRCRWPALGDFPAFRRDPLGFLADVARHGGHLARFRLGMRPYVLVSEPHLIEEVLVRQHASFVKIPGLQLSERIMGQGLLTSEGTAWRRQRQAVQPAFHREHLRRYGTLISQTALQHVGQWPRHTVMDASRLMARLAFDVACRTLLGTDMAAHAVAVTRALNRAMADFDRRSRSFLALPPSCPTAANRALEHAAQRLDDVVDAIMEESRSNGAAGQDVVSTLLRAKGVDGAPLSHREVRDGVMTILLAGHETTADALAWSLFLLSRHPGVRERMEAEERAVLGGRPAEAEDLRRLPYTQAVFRETLRLYPPAWAIGRRSTEPFVLGGERFSRGTHLLMSQWVVHRDEALFWQAKDYRPERWLDEAWVESLPRFAYFPFGGGPRGCIGSDFAQMEGPLVLAAIWQRVRFVMDGPDPEPFASVTLRMRRGLAMRIVDR